jgi:hypothetical protein
VADHRSKKSDSPIRLSGIEELEGSKLPLCELRDGKIRFSDEIKREHRRLKTSLFSYVLHSRFLVFVTAPLIYSCIVPFALLDLFISTYQSVCFPIYGIPKARRSDYMAIDRHKLRYLNALEGLNCTYCSYANGLFAYAVEIGARTEQHWCPIKHARRIQHAHDRYPHFIAYGDASAYRGKIDKLRNDFNDLKGR